MAIIKMTEKEILKKHPLTRELKRKIAAIDDNDPKLLRNMPKGLDVSKTYRPGRPLKENKKKQLNLRIDGDVVAFFKSTGPGWQTRINDGLRQLMQVTQKAAR